ncbi:hypothetical protein ACHAW5_010278 [Stephanodiscus triporus]|uniref:Uncharacterized protein n=1 Tax=Stephanodiscus triporus TaxID=2934178 RepID=A0ABD3NWY8_9STRA
MPRSSRNDNIPDDGTSAVWSAADDIDENTYDDAGEEERGAGGGRRRSSLSSSSGGGGGGRSTPALGVLFASCDEDALGSVHRAWAATVLLMAAFFAASIVEATKLHESGTGASIALSMASCWSAALHLILAILGTFILKRFSTSFTVGCFLGLTVVTSQQDLLLCVAFYHNNRGDPVYNVIFADLAFALFGVLTFFSLILGHFRHYVVVRS